MSSPVTSVEILSTVSPSNGAGAPTVRALSDIWSKNTGRVGLEQDMRVRHGGDIEGRVVSRVQQGIQIAGVQVSRSFDMSVCPLQQNLLLVDYILASIPLFRRSCSTV